MRQQQDIELLLDQFRRLGPQHDPRPAPSPSHTGLDDFTSTGGSLLLEQGRLALAQEFVKAMADTGDCANIFGVLLSGPNGVGESALPSA
jgi:hypothetical protein